MNLSEIATLVEGEITGDGAVQIRRVAKIEEAGEGDITFLANPKYRPYLETTRASAVIVSADTESSRRDVSLVRVRDPYLSFLVVLEKLMAPMERLAQGIHSTAIVDESARLGEGVAVGPHAVVGKRCTIGRGTQVHPNVVVGHDSIIGEGCTLWQSVAIRERCTVGNRVIIHPGTVIGGDGFGFAPSGDGTYRKIPQVGTVVVEDDVEIGANCAIDRATLGETRICRGVKLDNLIHVAHNCTVGENTVIAAQTGISGSTKIGRNCVIAGQVGIVGHIEIADHITIAAQSGVTKSFLEPGITIFGYPAKDRRESSRQEAALRHLPELRGVVKDLQKRIEELEARGK